jgi:hypothetical protein
VAETERDGRYRSVTTNAMQKAFGLKKFPREGNFGLPAVSAANRRAAFK